MELESDIEDSHSQPQQQQNQHFHVLAVDDSLIDRKLLERLLTVSSYQVTCVESGNKALEYLGLLDNTDNDSTTATCTSSSSQQSQQEMPGSKVNLIMTDYSMPGMSGYDLLKRVKGSSWKDIPVVVMSSENIPSRINMCLEGGAEEFLVKPVQLSDLRKLQSHLIKSLDHSCKTIDNNNIVDNENKNNNNNSSNNNDKSGTNANKRKAVSPDQSSERRHKMKELMCYN